MTDKQEYFTHTGSESRERAILAALVLDNSTTGLEEAERSLNELAELVWAAGGEAVGRGLQRRSSPDPTYLVGKGKILELRAACEAQSATMIVFDNELTGSQIRNIEKLTDAKVVDRTLVILDIFASRARSREGKLQIELAQLQYRLSRLVGLGQSLSRLGGGIGTRGPGESKLESDRRHISRRVLTLKKSLADMKTQRDRTRLHRHESEILTLAVVGYTNAGKSTLINKLCESNLLTADQVFATLDPSVRRLTLPNGSTVLLVDTVGLIRKLPHHLIEAFHATLEEAADADAILEVIDAADPDAASQMAVVEALLVQLEAAALPRFYVFNKMDRLPDGPVSADPDLVDRDPAGLSTELTASLPVGQRQQSFFVSALSGDGLETLIQAITDFSASSQLAAELLLPYHEAGLLDYIRSYGHLDKVEYLSEGILADIHIRYSHFRPLQPFVSKPLPDLQMQSDQPDHDAQPPQDGDFPAAEG